MKVTNARYLDVWSKFIVLSFACLMISVHAYADETQTVNRVFSLPSDIAQELRNSNQRGQRGSCGESSIFIHGFEYLDLGFHRLIWFLGAPDYLCLTNSFVPVTVDSNGEWTVGKNSEKDWRGSDLLDGAPQHFQHVDGIGFLLTAEWQIEGPRTLMYFSRDGVTWTSLDLPVPKHKGEKYDCCYAAVIDSLCLADSGDAYISYIESPEFHASAWIGHVDDPPLNRVDWRRVQAIPEEARCSRSLGREFIPHSLREKTEKGAIFDVALDWAVRIPGPTK